MSALKESRRSFRFLANMATSGCVWGGGCFVYKRGLKRKEGTTVYSCCIASANRNQRVFFFFFVHRVIAKPLSVFGLCCLTLLARMSDCGFAASAQVWERIRNGPMMLSSTSTNA